VIRTTYLIVPASTLRYGSILMLVMWQPCALSSRPRELMLMPLPRPDTTPPAQRAKGRKSEGILHTRPQLATSRTRTGDDDVFHLRLPRQRSLSTVAGGFWTDHRPSNSKAASEDVHKGLQATRRQSSCNQRAGSTTVEEGVQLKGDPGPGIGPPAGPPAGQAPLCPRAAPAGWCHGHAQWLACHTVRMCKLQVCRTERERENSSAIGQTDCLRAANRSHSQTVRVFQSGIGTLLS